MDKHRYYVNKNAQTNGDHEVHKAGCSYMPREENRMSLGLFARCDGAVGAARIHYSRVDGCAYCCPACHRH